MGSYYKSEDEIDSVVRGFELCTTRKEDFRHESHLTVAVWYLQEGTAAEASEKMKLALHRFLDHHAIGNNKYHETLTVFWIRLIADYLRRSSPDLSRLQLTNAVIETLGSSRLVFEYYSPELLKSEQARTQWLEPDLKSLPRP